MATHLASRRATRLAIALVGIAALLGVGAGESAAQRSDGPLIGESQERDERLGRDPFGAMGGDSPFCREAELRAVERRNCRGSGALSHPVRIDHYGFDIHIDTGVDNVAGNLAKGLQDIAQMGWMVLLYLVKGATLGLEWAFSLDLLGETLSDARRALMRLHNHVFGQEWLLAAMSAAGLWAIYRGLVQQRASEAFAGLAATVALMVVGLLIVNDPVGTVGRASELSNGAALGIVSGATTGSVGAPARGFGEAMGHVFDQSVLRPWCALQFSDVRFCLSKPREVIDPDDLPHDPEVLLAYANAPTVAEMFLAFEPNGEGKVDQRNAIYEEWKDKDDSRLQAVVRIQKEASTGPRLALLAVIAIGQLGMIALLGWLAMRLLGYGALSLVLLLVAPVMLLAPALGDSGRAAFVGWGKRLAGALIAKAVYAVVLAVVLVATATLAELDSLGWIAVWLLQAVTWWTLFLKRDEIVGLASASGLPGKGQRRPLLRRAFQAQRVARTARDAVGGASGFALGQTVGRLRERRAVEADAVQVVSEQALREQARPDLERRQAEARETVAHHVAATTSLRKVDGLLRSHDERSEVAKANTGPPPIPSDHEATLLRRREELVATKPEAERVGAAKELLRHADRNQARGEGTVTTRDEHAHIERRRREIDSLPVDHDHNLRAAGIDPRRYRDATDGDRDRLREDASQALERERARLAATPTTDGSHRPGRKEIREARATLDTEELRTARRNQTRASRAERRAARRAVPERRQDT